MHERIIGPSVSSYGCRPPISKFLDKMTENCKLAKIYILEKY